MNRRANKPVLDNDSFLRLRRLFFDRIQASVRENKMVMSDQMEVENLKLLIINFIESNSYSTFNILLLGDDQNIDRPSGGIIINNFKVYDDTIKPRQFLIGILPSWKQCLVYILSIDGRKIEMIVE